VVPVDNVNIQVEVKVFADNLPKQVALSASVSVTVKAREISALDLAFGSRSGVEKRSDALRAIRENKDPAFVAKGTRR
jgi:hypothetical protein